MMHHRLAVGADLQVDLDAIIVRNRGSNRASGILNEAVCGIVQPAMGDRPCGKPVDRSVPTSRHFEESLDFHRRVLRQSRDADGRARMPALVAKDRDHQVGRAVHDLRTFDEVGRGIHKAAEPHHPHHLVEIAERDFDMGEHIDRAGPRGFLAVLDRDVGADVRRLRAAALVQIRPETDNRLPVRTNGTRRPR